MVNRKSPPESEEIDTLQESKDDEKKKEKAEVAPLFSLFRYLTCWEIVQLVIMCVFSAIQGSAMPIFSLIFSQLLDSFNPTKSSGDTMEAVLRQEISWFDNNNFQELPTKMSAETEAIQKATGETFSMTVNALFAGIAGFIIAFIIGWKLAFILLGLFPIIICAVISLVKSMQGGFKDQAAAYSRSGAYAEQALNAIKVVSAFGQEEIEKENYNKHRCRLPLLVSLL